MLGRKYGTERPPTQRENQLPARVLPKAQYALHHQPPTANPSFLSPVACASVTLPQRW
ncbi:MAG: hypothetical protein ACHBN1_34710 [Heteroscytonema crispum UTEX LB 1556]